MKNRFAVSCFVASAVLHVALGVMTSVCVGAGSVVDQTDLVSVNVPPGQVRLIHDNLGGYAELPSLALTPEHAYISFDARTDGLTRLHLCRVDRTFEKGTGEKDIQKIIITGEEESSFGSSMAVEDGGSVWLAWTSLAKERWSIKACRVTDMQPSPELAISGTEGLNSQVRVSSLDGATWFVWALWEDGLYRVMANVFDGSLGSSQAVYEGPNPVGRPDVSIISADHVVFVWDEYIDGRFVVRRRDRVGGSFEPVQNLSGKDMANNWGARVCAGRTGVLATWQRVPWGEAKCAPAAMAASGIRYEDGLDLPSNLETWRVKCFAGPEGNTWAFWLNRRGHRSIRAYIRRVDSDGVSKLCRIRFRRQKNFFMQHLECACDQKLGLVWSARGSISFCEVEMPGPGPGELTPGSKDTPVAASASAASPKGQAREIGAAGGGDPVPDEDDHPDDDYEDGSGDRGIMTRRNPEYTISYAGESLHAYFGDFHNHTSFSDGRAFPDMAMLFGRDARKFDFICITDHDGPLMPSEFAWNNAVAEMLTEDGRYVCLRGFEISKNWAKNGFGHWNMLFPGPVTIFRYADGMTPDDLYEVANDYGAVLIPHHIAKHFAPHNWDYQDAQAEPVVEMCSIHGVFETRTGQEDARDLVEGHFVDDGLARGYIMGFVGSSDFHNPFEAIRREVGITGVYAPSLTSDSVLDAFKMRRTFATTGGMIVVDFRCNGRLMGESLEASGEINFHGYADSPDSIRSLEIISGSGTVFEMTVSDTTAGFDWTTSVPDSMAYYYLRVTTASDMAWSSPIWISPAE